MSESLFRPPEIDVRTLTVESPKKDERSIRFDINEILDQHEWEIITEFARHSNTSGPSGFFFGGLRTISPEHFIALTAELNVAGELRNLMDELDHELQLYNSPSGRGNTHGRYSRILTQELAARLISSHSVDEHLPLLPKRQSQVYARFNRMLQIRSDRAKLYHTLGKMLFLDALRPKSFDRADYLPSNYWQRWQNSLLAYHKDRLEQARIDTPSLYLPAAWTLAAMRLTDQQALAALLEAMPECLTQVMTTMHDARDQRAWIEFFEWALLAKIIAAKDISVDETGLRIEDAAPVHRPAVPDALPEQRKY